MTTEPFTRPVPVGVDVAEKGEAVLLAVSVPEPEPEQPVSSPPATAPAVTRARRREYFVRRYSYCSAMLIRRASCGGMPTSGVSMLVNFPACPNNRHTYG